MHSVLVDIAVIGAFIVGVVAAPFWDQHMLHDYLVPQARNRPKWPIYVNFALADYFLYDQAKAVFNCRVTGLQGGKTLMKRLRLLFSRRGNRWQGVLLASGRRGQGPPSIRMPRGWTAGYGLLAARRLVRAQTRLVVGSGG